MNADISDAIADGIILRMAQNGHVMPAELDRLIAYITGLRKSRPRPPK